MKVTVSIKNNYEFIRAYKKGKYFVGKYLILYIQRYDQKINMLGITASKKVGKSVIRNRLKRLVKENYRYFEEFLYYGFKMIFVIRSTEELPLYKDINRDMKSLLKRAGILDKTKWEKE